MPVILATWEAEIRRITVEGQQEQIVHHTHLQNNQSKGWRSGSNGNSALSSNSSAAKI
jgi:hypothetical protein